MFSPGVNATASAEAGRMEEMEKRKPESIYCCFVTRRRPHMDFQIVRWPADKLQTHPQIDTRDIQFTISNLARMRFDYQTIPFWHYVLRVHTTCFFWKARGMFSLLIYGKVYFVYLDYTCAGCWLVNSTSTISTSSLLKHVHNGKSNLAHPLILLAIDTSIAGAIQATLNLYVWYSSSNERLLMTGNLYDT